MAPSNEALKWLGKALTTARERAGLGLYDIVALVQKRSETVKRWEDGEHLARDMDKVLEAYASAAGLDGPLALWDLALELWHADDAAKQIEAQTRQAGQPHDAPDSASAPTPPGEGAEGRGT